MILTLKLWKLITLPYPSADIIGICHYVKLNVVNSFCQDKHGGNSVLPSLVILVRNLRYWKKCSYALPKRTD
jgi:hypothetical protein